jgi:peptide/nickel transport system substrate-binding protein
MEVLDSKTLRIKLKHKYSPLASGISLFSAAVVSQKAYEADPEAFGENPTCSGAFLVESFKRGDRLVLVANENHWDGRPYLDRVEMLYVPEGNSRVIVPTFKTYDS